MSRVRMVLLAASVLVLATVLWTSPAVGSADAFTGAWVAADPGDGSTLKLQIGESNASGVRHVTLMDQNQLGSGCGALATAIGSGTVSGSTLFSTLAIKCGGAPVASDVPVDFAVVGDTLVGFGVVWERAVGPADVFTGGWVATDPGDGSTLKLQIGESNASGVRHVTLMDQNQLGSGCGALATAIGSGTVFGTTLSATLDIRCGGSLVATDVLFTFAAVGDTLVGFGVVWERAGG